nr:uncharacterized protein LOC111516846 [Leptinotarsa decemlineata]
MAVERMFLAITRPDGACKITDNVKHKTVHHIHTTPSQPVAVKPRRLSRDRLNAAKKEFESMLRLGICRPSESSWASPYHMVHKKDVVLSSSARTKAPLNDLLKNNIKGKKLIAWNDTADAAEMVYGEPLRLPGEFLASTSTRDIDDSANFIRELRQHFQAIRPVSGTRHGKRKLFVFKDLATASHVFVKHDASGGPLQLPYEVVSRAEKHFTLAMRGRNVPVSIDRLKPAYIIPEDIAAPEDNLDGDDTFIPTTPGDDQAPLQQEPSSPPACRTRSGRRVRFTKRYQAGFS